VFSSPGVYNDSTHTHTHTEETIKKLSRSSLSQMR
jgi:hypothetical protein